MNDLKDYRDLPVRRGVGLALTIPYKILVCKRRGTEEWQLPQGGVDEGEALLAAAWRELQEELGLTRTDVDFIGKVDAKTYYDLPEAWGRQKGCRGQEHNWFMFRHPNREWHINPVIDLAQALDQEFSEVMWKPFDGIEDFLLAHCHPMRVPVYQQVLPAVRNLIVSTSSWVDTY